MGPQEVLFAEVDKALYVAKSNGRNCLAMLVDGEVRTIKSGQRLGNLKDD
jgi:hypothetical protein